MPRHASLFQIFYFLLEWIFYQLLLLTKSRPCTRPEENVEGKIAIITGANTGLGKNVAEELAKRGATVIMACRNIQKGEEALKEIQLTSGSDKLELLELDLGDLSSIRKFATIVQERYDTIDILINNAGVASITGKLCYTVDGFELHMGTNHLGHFLLTSLLLDNIKQASSGRVVIVSSSMAVTSSLDVNDLMMSKATRFGLMNILPYSNSKFANALFNKELGKRLKGTSVTTYAVCPGFVTTNISRYFSKISFSGRVYQAWIGGIVGHPVHKGADGILYCAVAKELSQSSGKWYRFYKEIPSIEPLLTDELALSLWKESEKLVMQ